MFAKLAIAIGTSIFLGGLPAASAAASAMLRLYILDCGTISASGDPSRFGLKQEEVKSDGSFVTPCYLVVHPKGTLMWEVGEIPDVRIKDDGTETIEDRFRATKRLTTQLKALGYEPKDITYLAVSHYHTDHTANANLFAGSTWIVQEAEYDAMFGDAPVRNRNPELFSELKSAKRVTLKNADHDVFGDGTVIIKTAPGHTPGHQMLYLKLGKFGPLLLSGDLYHLPEEKTLDRVPVMEFDGALTRASRKTADAFIAQTGATLWIQHDPATNARLKTAPAFYD